MDKEDLKYINAGILGCSESELTEDLLYDEETDLPLCTSDKQDLLNSMGDTLYHCTPRKNLESIYKNGLKNFWFSDTTGDLKDMVNSNYDYEYTGNELVILYFPKSKLDLSKVDFTDCNNGEDDVWNNYGYYNGTISITEENLLEEELKPRVKEDLSQEVDSEGNQLTQEQINFFRNSKVRDSQGKLLVCYHGSKSSFDTFDKSKIKPWGWYGKGFYFTPSQNVASNYSEGNLITCYLNITNPFYADSSFTSKEEYYNRCDKLYELVGITKEEIDKQDEECRYTSDPYYKLLMYLTHINSSKDINDYVKELGYDGVIGLDAYGGEEQELIIFEPNQIKSITNKTPNNSDNINEDWLSDAKKTETIKQELNQACDDLMGNDKTRLYRYREWANNSNNDYKEYIYNDLKKNKDKSLRLWYNTYRLRSGDYDLSYDDFLNTPITLYRATNVNEKDDTTNPFFSYAQSKKLAQRFLDTTQRLYQGRTGEIEEISIKPKDTLGMIPSDEYEIIVPNKAYQSRVDDMSNIVDNVIKYANENNVELPYTREYMLTLFNRRDKENVKKLETHLINYINKRRNGSSNNINEDLEQLHNYIEDNFGTNNFPKASSYILENGKYVDILGKGLEYHGDLDDELVSTFPEDEDIMNYVDEDGFIPMNLVKKLFPNIIKMNNGSRDVDSMFIELSDNVPTEEQLDSLIKWALTLPNENIVIYNHKNNIQAYVPTNKITKDYIKSLYGVKEDSTVKIESLTEGKQDIENFKKWIEETPDSPARYMSGGNKEAYVNNFVNAFNEERKNLKPPFNDYYYWIKQNDWNAFTKMIADQGEKKASKQREKDGAKLIYSDNDWKVYEITTYEASVKYGANTKWCISGSKRWSNGENGRGYWDDYTSKGVKFYFFIGKDTKYAIALYPNGTDFEIFDAQDNAITYIPNAPIIDKIKVDYYSQNEDRLMLNLIKTGQLPHVCIILSNYLREHGWDIDVYDKSEFDTFLNQISENVNGDYVKWLAVYNGLKDEEWYKQETGEEYEDEWGGDTTWYLSNDLGFLDNYATLEDALTKDNPYFNYDNNEYFISDFYDCDIDCCKDWVSVWLYIGRYIEDETELINYIKRSIRDDGDYEDFEKVGLSKEYLLGESLEENLREDKDTVEFLYHGSPSPTLNLERDSTLWLAEDYGYAIGFGPYLHICSAYIPNILEVGDTDGYIRGLIPTQFSPKFTEIANKLNMQPKELLRACGEDCKNIYSLVRTKQFRKICMEKGYDAVETEEFGNICYGVFNRHNVELIDTEDKEDEPTPMNESKEELLKH